MADSITVLVPKITAAQITPNPANMNTSITIAVTLTEESKTLEPVYVYSGRVFSGQIWGQLNGN